MRRAAAAALRTASAVLAYLAHRVAVPAAAPAAALPVSAPLPGVLEFYADSGAPEGALYLDGELVGWIAGVRRL